MEPITPLPPPVPSAPPGNPIWVAGLLALAVLQGALTLTLFGPETPLSSLLDERPIVSGRHPLHQYHGYLGARSLLQHGCMSCYDPTFHAGYLKTPVFDSGSRPAEFLFLLAGGEFRPAAYKIGLAVLCTTVPLLFWFAARGLRLPRGAALLTALLGVVLFWQPACQGLLRSGNVDLLMAGLLVLAQAGGLLRYHEQPGIIVWAGVVLAGFFAWFAHPVLLAMLLPPALIYHFQVGPSHRPIWHACLVAGLLSAIAANSFWLSDWIGYWWLRVPVRLDGITSAETLLPTLWFAAPWGDLPHRILAVALLGLSLPGLLLLLSRGQAPAAVLFGLYLVELLVLAVLGIASTFFSALEVARVFELALFFAVPLAVVVLHALFRGAVLLLLVPALWLLPVGLPGSLRPMAEPLRLGFDPEQQVILDTLRSVTTSQARILWEDQSDESSRWTALLSQATGRSFIGGLDPDPDIEHLTNGLHDQVLMSRPLREWTDSQLAEYCERYNVGWIVAWAPATQRRLESWSALQLRATLRRGRQEGRLYIVDRRPGYALVGQAEMVHADDQKIILSNVQPYQGRVVLSLHHIAGLRAHPSRVTIEPEIDPRDPIPRVRLILQEPVTRLTLTWSRR